MSEFQFPPLAVIHRIGVMNRATLKATKWQIITQCSLKRNENKKGISSPSASVALGFPRQDLRGRSCKRLPTRLCLLIVDIRGKWMHIATRCIAICGGQNGGGTADAIERSVWLHSSTAGQQALAPPEQAVQQQLPETSQLVIGNFLLRFWTCRRE